MIPEFENASFELEKKGDYSKPFKSFYGWHIVKLLDKKEILNVMDQGLNEKGKKESVLRNTETISENNNSALNNSVVNLNQLDSESRDNLPEDETVSIELSEGLLTGNDEIDSISEVGDNIARLG